MASSELVVHVKPQLDNLVLARPGDTLVIGASDVESYSDSVIEEVKAALPGVKIVVMANVSAFAVYRPDEMPEWEREFLARQAQEQAEPEDM